MENLLISSTSVTGWKRGQRAQLCNEKEATFLQNEAAWIKCCASAGWNRHISVEPSKNEPVSIVKHPVPSPLLYAPLLCISVLVVVVLSIIFAEAVGNVFGSIVTVVPCLDLGGNFSCYTPTQESFGTPLVAFKLIHKDVNWKTTKLIKLY